MGKWGKMNADVAPLKAPLQFWRLIRENVMRTLGVEDSTESRVGSRGLPVVVYVDNQVSRMVHDRVKIDLEQSNTPKLSDVAHARLVESLKGLTSVAEVHVTRLSGMTRAQQVELMGRAEVSRALQVECTFGSLTPKADAKCRLSFRSISTTFSARFGCPLRSVQLLSSYLRKEGLTVSLGHHDLRTSDCREASDVMLTPIQEVSSYSPHP